MDNIEKLKSEIIEMIKECDNEPVINYFHAQFKMYRAFENENPGVEVTEQKLREIVSIHPSISHNTLIRYGKLHTKFLNYITTQKEEVELNQLTSTIEECGEERLKYLVHLSESWNARPDIIIRIFGHPTPETFYA